MDYGSMHYYINNRLLAEQLYVAVIHVSLGQHDLVCDCLINHLQDRQISSQCSCFAAATGERQIASVIVA